MSGERKLWGFPPSIPVRSVLLTLKALNLDYKLEVVNTMLGDQVKPEFLKKNPQHTVPVLEEPDGTCIWDSHAICAYLVRRYGKDDSLYPKDFYKRAVVDQRLHFENGVLFTSCWKNNMTPFYLGQCTKSEFEEKQKKFYEAYDMLEKFLNNNEYMAGDSLTIADFSIVSTISSFVLVAPIAANKWPQLSAWLGRMSKLPYYAEAQKGLEFFESFIKEKLKLIKE